MTSETLFAQTDEQRMLQDILRAYLNHGRGRSAAATDDRSDAARFPEWQALATELGVLAVALPDNEGGLGGGAAETMIVMGELGAARCTEPFLEAVVVAGGILRRASTPLALDILRGLATGGALPILAADLGTAWDGSDGRLPVATCQEGRWSISGDVAMVSAGQRATHFLVPALRDGEGSTDLFVVEADQAYVKRHEVPTIDGRGMADIQFSSAPVAGNVAVATGTALSASLIEAHDEAIAALAGEASGLIRAMIGDTVAFLKQRRQFGKPLSEFQALQHRLADMHMWHEDVRSACCLSVLAATGLPRDRSRTASAVKTTVNDALRFVGQNSVQLHGGMGMTDELSLARYFKRATAIERDLGDVDHHLHRHMGLALART